MEREKVVSVCLHAFRVKIAREQGTGKSIRRERKGGRRSGGSVLGDTSWRGERGVVSGEGKGEKKSHLGWISREDKLVREKGRGVRSHRGRGSMLERNTLAVTET